MSMDFLRYEKEFPSFLSASLIFPLHSLSHSLSLLGTRMTKIKNLRKEKFMRIVWQMSKYVIRIFFLFLHISFSFVLFLYFHSNHTCKKKYFAFCMMWELCVVWCGKNERENHKMTFFHLTFLSSALSHSTGSILFREL
jgi:hypothetical protein